MLDVTTLLVLAAFLALLHDTLADHHTCSWTGPGDNPEASGYKEYCTGAQTDATDTTANYICDFGQGTLRLVADYGVLAARTLEFATACNGHGYLKDEAGNCCCDHVGVCLGDRDSKTKKYSKCYYMSVFDDCQWPQEIAEKNKPGAVHIWIHKEDQVVGRLI